MKLFHRKGNSLHKTLVMILFVVLLSFGTVLFLGCTEQEDTSNGEEDLSDEEAAEQEENDQEQEAQGITIVDDMGAEVHFESHPETVVSLMPNLTETIFALNLSDEILGVSTFCDYPEQALDKPTVGDSFDLNMEKVASLEPDVVVMGAGEMMGDARNKIEEMGIQTLAYDPKDIEGITDMMTDFGEIFAKKDEAQTVVEELEESKQKLEEEVAELDEIPTIFVLLDTDSLFTVGEGEFMSEVIALAGADNIALEEGSGYFELNQELLLDKDPDVIITTFPDTQVIEEMGALAELTAVKEERVYEADGDLLSRPGPRIMDGAWELFELLHR